MLKIRIYFLQKSILDRLFKKLGLRFSPVKTLLVVCIKDEVWKFWVRIVRINLDLTYFKPIYCKMKSKPTTRIPLSL